MSGGPAASVERPDFPNSSRNLKDLFGTEYSILPRGVERLPETILSSPAKRILGFYCRLPGPRWESVSTIESETGLSRPTVTKSRALLVGYGFLIELPQHKGRGNASNCYAVNHELVKHLNQESTFTSLDAFTAYINSFTKPGKASLPKKNEVEEAEKNNTEIPSFPTETDGDDLRSPSIPEEASMPLGYTFESFMSEVREVLPELHPTATVETVFLALGDVARPGIGRAMAQTSKTPGGFVATFRENPLGSEPVREFVAAAKARDREREKDALREKLRGEHEERLKGPCPICGGRLDSKSGFSLLEECVSCHFQTGLVDGGTSATSGFEDILQMPFSERLAAYQEREERRKLQISQMMDRFRGLASA